MFSPKIGGLFFSTALKRLDTEFFFQENPIFKRSENVETDEFILEFTLKTNHRTASTVTPHYQLATWVPIIYLGYLVSCVLCNICQLIN